MSDEPVSRVYVCEGGCGRKMNSIGWDDGKNVCPVCRWIAQYPNDPAVPGLRLYTSKPIGSA